MSAFIVSDKHINALANYFTSPVFGEGLWTELESGWNYARTKQDAEFIAKTLYAANVKGVNERYNETEDTNFGGFKSDPFTQYTAGEIAGAIDCLEYQANEADDWEESQAKKMLDNMRKHLLNKVLRENGEEMGWDIA